MCVRVSGFLVADAPRTQKFQIHGRSRSRTSQKVSPSTGRLFVATSPERKKPATCARDVSVVEIRLATSALDKSCAADEVAGVQKHYNDVTLTKLELDYRHRTLPEK